MISELAEGGHSGPEIAAYLGCSVWTVRKWKCIFDHPGGKASHRGLEYDATRVADDIADLERGSSWVGTGESSGHFARRPCLENLSYAQSFSGGSLPQTSRIDTLISTIC